MLRAAIGVAAGVMVVAGTYLLDPAAVDLGFELEAARTWIVGVCLLATAAAFVFKLAFPKGLESGFALVDLLVGYIVGQLSLYAFGIILTVLGGQALLATPPNFWVALLLVPGLLGVVFAFSEDDGTRKAEPAAHEKADETSPESGQVNIGASVRFSVAYGAIFAAYMAAVVGWIAVAFWLYYRLNDVIFNGGTFDSATAGTSLWEFVRAMLPGTLPALIVGVVAIVVVTLLTAVFQWFSLRGVRDGNRDLTPGETAYIDASAESVAAYAKAQGYDRNVWVVQLFGFVAVMAAIGVGAWVAIGGEGWLERQPAGPSFPLTLHSPGLSLLGFMFAAFGLSVLPHALLSRLSRSYSERCGWVAIGEKSEYFSLKGKLTTFVRSRVLSTATPLNPGVFLHQANVSFEPYFYWPTALVLAVTLFFVHRDVNAIDVLAADTIELTDYWTLTATRYTYGDVARVELRCFLTDKGEAVEAYELQLKDGETIDIYKNQAFVERQFAAFEAIDAKLVAQGATFFPGPHRGWFKRDERGYDPDCVERVAEGFAEELQPKVRKLFHLDEMRAVEKIWPWDAELAEAQRAAEDYEVEKAVALFTKKIDSGRLPPNLLAVAYTGRANARDYHTIAYGLSDAAMLLALRDYQKAREIAPSVDAYESEAVAFMALGAYGEASAAFRKALELDKPKPYWPLLGLARVERVRGNYDAALKHLDEVMRVWGEDNVGLSAFYGRARVLYLKGDNAGVVAAISKGLTDRKPTDDAMRYRACAYARLGAFDKAKGDIAEALKISHTPPLSEAWEKTPLAKANRADLARDRATIDAMAAGTATEGDKAALCVDTWRYRETPRTRSELLPAGG